MAELPGKELAQAPLTENKPCTFFPSQAFPATSPEA
jgi:hypothetical protein